MTETLFVGGAPRIAVAVAGRGPLVLFLHGIGGNRNHWLQQLGFFSRHGFKAAAWDARGYGDSEDYDGPLQFDDFSSDLLRVLDFLGERKAHLVGLSMGGRIARNFALKHPQRVRTLTLANTSPGFDALTPEEVLKFVDEHGQPGPYPINPNGSQGDVAGVCDASGRVLGLMPHPERHVLPTQHPRWTRKGLAAEGDGLRLFRNAVEYFA